jgi:hypothetical protein
MLGSIRGSTVDDPAFEYSVLHSVGGNGAIKNVVVMLSFLLNTEFRHDLSSNVGELGHKSVGVKCESASNQCSLERLPKRGIAYPKFQANWL